MRIYGIRGKSHTLSNSLQPDGRGRILAGEAHATVPPSTQHKQFPPVRLQPTFSIVGMRRQRVHQMPKARTVVGVAEVAEFVDADIVGDVLGRVDQPPIEADAGVRAAYAPKGFSVAQVCGSGSQPCFGCVFSRRGSRYSRARSFNRRRRWSICAAVSFRGSRISDDVMRIWFWL